MIMPDGPIVNSALLSALAACRHGDVVVIADIGLPVPHDTREIDLSLVTGEPGFDLVLSAVLGTLVVESAVVAEETEGSPAADVVRRRLHDLPVQRVPHDVLKVQAGRARLVVRTGEHTPYANVALVAGVPF